jgi:GH18 family chitinase
VVNVVNFAELHNLDGLGFSYEYPGYPGVPDAPQSKLGGANYARSLKDGREYRMPL